MENPISSFLEINGQVTVRNEKLRRDQFYLVNASKIKQHIPSIHLIIALNEQATKLIAVAENLIILTSTCEGVNDDECGEAVTTIYNVTIEKVA